MIVPAVSNDASATETSDAITVLIVSLLLGAKAVYKDIFSCTRFQNALSNIKYYHNAFVAQDLRAPTQPPNLTSSPEYFSDSIADLTISKIGSHAH